MKEKKICDYCKKEFKTKDKRRVTCSPKCSRKRMKIKIREYCKEYHKRPEIKEKKKEYYQKNKRK